MRYFKKISSLKEKALYQVAVNLTEDDNFKEVAMCFEKPTYDILIFDSLNTSSSYISGPEVLSACFRLKKYELKGDNQSAHLLVEYLWSSDQNKIKLWDDAVEKQCQRLTVGFPSSLKHELHIWMERFALEYLSYIRRQELLFGVSRYFLIGVLTRNDWTEAGRLNERKIAVRLINDERLSILQRYRIACVYCLQMNIVELWNRLTHEEKKSVCENNSSYCHENKSLVLLWSNYMNGHQNKKSAQQRHDLWSSVANTAVCYGNQTALMLGWENLQQHERQQLIVHMAYRALQDWELSENYDQWKINLLSYENCSTSEAPERIKNFNLPSYYSELVCFFLPKMSEEQILDFFELAFEVETLFFDVMPITAMSVLDCLLDRSVLDYFLPTINLLWGKILPKYSCSYERCLLSLVCRYTGECKSYRYKKFTIEEHHDYQSIIWSLWEEMPDEYKQHLFYNKRESSDDYNTTPISSVLFLLLKKNPFQKKDVALFKRIWHDLPKEIKKAMIEFRKRNICWILLQKEKWPLVNWLLKESLTNVEISNYKKQLIQSKCLKCFSKLEKSCYKFVENLIDWCFELDTEKSQFRVEIFNQGVETCSFSLSKGKFTEVETMINFCSSSNEMRKEFKEKISRGACKLLLKDCKWEMMDRILAWCYADEEEEIRSLKKFLFSCEGIFTHFKLVFSQREGENVEDFYRWFCLSTEEIIKIKKETVFMPAAIDHVHEALYKDIRVESCLHWCLTNEEMVTNFKEEIEKKYFNKMLRKKKDKKAKECLDYLISKLLEDFRKEEVVPDITDRCSISVEDNGEKHIFSDRSGSPLVRRSSRKKLKTVHH